MAFKNSSDIIGNVGKVIYSCLVGEEASIHALYLNNASDLTETVTVSLFNNSTGVTSNILVKDLEPKEFFNLDKPINLAEYDSLSIVSSGTNSVFTASVFSQTIAGVSTSLTLNPRGDWSSLATYEKLDMVALNGSSYVAISANTDDIPPSANWGIVASAGVGAISSLVEDTTPQLGGNLDLNGNKIIGLETAPTLAQWTDSLSVGSTKEFSLSESINHSHVSTLKEVPSVNINNNDWSIKGGSTTFNVINEAYTSDITLSGLSGNITITLTNGTWSVNDINKTISAGTGIAKITASTGTSIVDATVIDNFDSATYTDTNWKLESLEILGDRVNLSSAQLANYFDLNNQSNNFQNFSTTSNITYFPGSTVTLGRRVLCGRFNETGTKFLTVESDYKFYLYDVTKPFDILTLTNPISFAPTQISSATSLSAHISFDGTKITVRNNSGTYYWYTIANPFTSVTYTYVATTSSGESNSNPFAFTPDGKWLYVWVSSYGGLTSQKLYAMYLTTPWVPEGISSKGLAQIPLKYDGGTYSDKRNIDINENNILMATGPYSTANYISFVDLNSLKSEGITVNPVSYNGFFYKKDSNNLIVSDNTQITSIVPYSNVTSFEDINNTTSFNYAALSSFLNLGTTWFSNNNSIQISSDGTLLGIQYIKGILLLKTDSPYDFGQSKARLLHHTSERSFTFNIHNNTTDFYALYNDGTYWNYTKWPISSLDSRLAFTAHNIIANYLDTNVTALPIALSQPKVYGNKLYLQGSDTQINEYNISGFSNVTSVNSKGTLPSIRAYAFSSNGLHLYVVSTNGSIYRYALSTAWSISTASEAESKALATQPLQEPPSDPAIDTATEIHGLFINSDGTEITFIATTGLIVIPLSTPYSLGSMGSRIDSKSVIFTNVTTFTNADSYYTNNGNRFFHYGSDRYMTTEFNENLYRGWSNYYNAYLIGSDKPIEFSKDGTKLLTLNGSSLNEYNLSTPFNLLTVSLINTKTIKYTSRVIANSIGTKLWQSSGKIIVEYTLSTPWDITTIDDGKFYFIDAFDKAGNTDNLHSIISITGFNPNTEQSLLVNIGHYTTGATTLTYGLYTVTFNTPNTLSNGAHIHKIIPSLVSTTSIHWNFKDNTVLSNNGSSSPVIYSYNDFTTVSTLKEIPSTPTEILFNSSGLIVSVIYNSDVYEYELYQEYDLTKIKRFIRTYDLSNLTSVTGVGLNSTGTKAYISTSAAQIYEYNLATPYDLSDMSLVGSTSIIDTLDYGVTVTSDNKLIIKGNTKLAMYSLNGESVTGMTLHKEIIYSSIASTGNGLYITSTIYAINFLEEGTKVLLKTNSNLYYILDLNTPWDITSITENKYVNVLRFYNVVNPTSNYNKVVVSPMGEFIIDMEGNSVYKFYTKTTDTDIKYVNNQYIPLISDSSINTSYWTDINNMEVFGSKDNLYALSLDGRNNWYIYNSVGTARKIVRNNSNIWQYNNNAVFESENWISSSKNTLAQCLKDAMSITTNRSSFNDLEALVDSEYPVLTNVLDVAVIFYTDNEYVNKEYRSLQINYDSNSVWETAIPGEDYYTQQLSDTLVKFVSLSDNNFKVRAI